MPQFTYLNTKGGKKKKKKIPCSFCHSFTLQKLSFPFRETKTSQPHGHTRPREGGALTKKGQDPTDRPDHERQSHAARVLQHALGRDEDPRAYDGANDDGDAPQQGDLLLQHHFLLLRGLAASRGGQRPLHIPLQVASFGDSGHDGLSDHSSDPRGKNQTGEEKAELSTFSVS